MSFEERYRTTKDVFGSEPEQLLQTYHASIDRSRAVLDVGAGQGRNALFLARNGFRVDAIEPAPAGVQALRAAAEAERLPVRCFTCGFEDFSPQVDSYSAILLFGMIPVLPWDSIASLVGFVECWLHPGGLVFVSGFTTADDSYARRAREGSPVGRHSFSDPLGEVRTYLEPEQLLTLFPGYEAVHYWEGVGPEHHHGDGRMHRHALFEAVLRR